MNPKSLTAVVHVTFHYKEPLAKPLDEGQIEIMGKIMDHASELPAELQEVLVKFANYLGEFGKAG